MEVLKAIQDSAFSLWIRESSWAIFFFLIVHTLTMGFLAGTGAAISLRILGVARGVAISRLASLLPIMIWALPFAIASGVLLVVGYPAKALTNPLFYVKMAMLLTVAFLTWRMARRVFADPTADQAPVNGSAKALAVTCLILWIAIIVAGRFLAYTHKILLVY